MATLSPSLERRNAPAESESVLLGGYSALAESAWMGSVQATEVMDALRVSPEGQVRKRIIPHLPRIRLAGLYLRELSIAEASFVLMASFFLSALLGAVRQILFNAQFGAGSEASAYYAAFRLPDTLFSLIAGGALSSAMIPVLLGTAQSAGKKATMRLINLVMTLLMVVITLVVIVLELFAPFFVKALLAPGFDEPTTKLTTNLTRIMLIQPLILVVGSVATAVLNSRNQFIPTALSILGHNITLIAGILAVRADPRLGILGPTFGVVGGAVFQALVLLPGLLAQGTRFHPVLALADARLREIIRLLSPNGLAVGVNYSGFIVDTAFASKTTQVAALPALYNAFLLVGLPIALIGQAIGQAAFPRLAEHAAAGQWLEMRKTLLRTVLVAIGLATPALLALLFLGRLAIHILFEHGKFGASAGSLTFQVLSIYAFGLPAYVTTELVTRGLIAVRDTRTPLITNLLQLAGRIALMSALIHSLDVLAIPAAFAIAATVETIVLATVLLIKLRQRVRAFAVAEVVPATGNDSQGT